MYLNLEACGQPMKMVYTLRDELRGNPELVARVQALTLNRDKPLLGLKGTHGLYGSEAWWASIDAGRIKIKTVVGMITELFFAGQDSRWGDQVNSFRMKIAEGAIVEESIYAHEKADRRLFRPGATLCVAYVLNELKMQPAPNGGLNYSPSVLEMAVSLVPREA